MFEGIAAAIELFTYGLSGLLIGVGCLVLVKVALLLFKSKE